MNRLHRKGGLHAGWSGGWQWSRDGEMPRLRLEIVKRSDDMKSPAGDAVPSEFVKALAAVSPFPP